MSTAPVLSVRGLVTRCHADGDSSGLPPSVDHVSFEIGEGRVVGLVGESGSGKTLTALSLVRLLPPGARTTSGQIQLDGRDLMVLSEPEMQAIRGRKIAMIFQEPVTALSPVHSVGWHLRMVLLATGQIGASFGRQRREGRSKACELLGRVELPDPESLLDAHPHQLSAGMRRRVLVAMALAGRPRLLIADEPTTGLDAPIQAQLLDLLTRLTREERVSTLLISHDPEVVAEVASDVLVMHAGQIVEAGPVHHVFAEPRHPYTRGLLESVRARRRTRDAGAGETPLHD